MKRAFGKFQSSVLAFPRCIKEPALFAESLARKCDGNFFKSARRQGETSTGASFTKLVLYGISAVPWNG